MLIDIVKLVYLFYVFKFIDQMDLTNNLSALYNYVFYTVFQNLFLELWTLIFFVKLKKKLYNIIDQMLQNFIT